MKRMNFKHLFKTLTCLAPSQVLAGASLLQPISHPAPGSCFWAGDWPPGQPAPGGPHVAYCSGPQCPGFKVVSSSRTKGDRTWLSWPGSSAVVVRCMRMPNGWTGTPQTGTLPARSCKGHFRYSLNNKQILQFGQLLKVCHLL